MATDKIVTYLVGTNGAAFVPTANFPVRLYTTGGASLLGTVVRCTGGQDGKAIGIAMRGVTTTGLPVAVAVNEGYRFLGRVATTVAQGDNLKINNGSRFTSVVAIATNTVHFTARVVEARTNTGLTWLEFVPNGVV